MPAFNLWNDFPDIQPRVRDMFRESSLDTPNPIESVSIENMKSTTTHRDIQLILIKKLVIVTSVGKEIFPIIRGKISEISDHTIRIETSVFSALGATMCFENAIAEQMRINGDWYFKNWFSSGFIPKYITYENISLNTSQQLSPGVNIDIDLAIGTTMDDGNGKGIFKFYVEYEGSTPTCPKGMHPSEFFSLLYWSESSDYVLSQHSSIPPIPTTNESNQFLIRNIADIKVVNRNFYIYEKLMNSLMPDSNGSLTSDQVRIDEVQWLGLKPPLRTSKRAEWEARVIYLFQDPFRWATTRHLNTDLDYQNPMIIMGTLANESKCNVLCGELCYRSGFRVFIKDKDGVTRVMSNYNNIIEKKYNSSTNLMQILNAPQENQLLYPLYSRKPLATKKNNLTEDEINQLINNGMLFIFARGRISNSTNDDGLGFHIFIFRNIRDKGNPNGLNGTFVSELYRFDQHCTQNPFEVPKHSTQRPNSGYRIPDIPYAYIQVAPGGDPTEKWGAFDLNGFDVPNNIT